MCDKYIPESNSNTNKAILGLAFLLSICFVGIIELTIAHFRTPLKITITMYYITIKMRSQVFFWEHSLMHILKTLQHIYIILLF